MRPRLALPLWLLFLAVCALIAARTSYRTDMGDFLPRTHNPAQQALEAQVSGGAASQIMLLGIEGAPAPVLAGLSQRLAASLRAQPAFLDVMNGGASSFAGVQDYVWHNRYLLSPRTTAQHFTPEALHAALQQDLALLSSGLGPALSQSLPADPTGEMFLLLRQFTPGSGPAMRDGVWFSADGKTALLLAHTKAPGFDLDSQQKAQDAITAAFAAARAAMPGAAATRLIMSGPGVFATTTRDTTKQDVQRLSILAMLGAASLLIFAYRSPLMLALGLLPILTGALAAIAAVSLCFGFVHGITLGFGVTLIGESLDYAIYLFTQTGQSEHGTDTLRRIWPTLRLGALTSIAGFAAMLGSSFTGFAQLGLFSIAGLIGAAATTRFILPHLMPRHFYASGAAPLARPVLALLRHQISARALLALALLASLTALITHRGPMWDDNLLNLSPLPPALQQRDAMLRAGLGITGQRYFAVFTAPDEQRALDISETLAPLLTRLTAAGDLSGFSLPSAILPGAEAQRARQSALPDAATLRANFTAAAAGLPFKLQAFTPFFADAAAAKTAPLLTAQNLPPALALQYHSMLISNGSGVTVMAPLQGVKNPAAIAQALAGAGPKIQLADLDAQSTALLQNFQRQAVTLAIAGSAAILLLLWLGLRSIGAALRIAAPLGLAVILTAALLTAGGAKLSIFMVAGFLLIVAIGSNYCLFFARGAAGEGGQARAISSIVLANLCTVAAYGLLSCSRIPVLHGIGLTVALGTFLSLICGALLSPPRPAPQ